MATTESRYADLLTDLKFEVRDPEEIPPALRAWLPALPLGRPGFLVVPKMNDARPETTALVVIDETGVCWTRMGVEDLKARGFEDLREIKGRQSAN